MKNLAIAALMNGGTLRGADLRGADLSDADLRGTKLSEANLSEADLLGANLIRANLSEANLFRADLIGANLLRANLSEANLRRANLRNADLSGADLSGADLSGAIGFHLLPVQDARGYAFAHAIQTDAGWRVRAGCRDFSITEALAHWGSPDYPDAERGAMYVHAIQWLMTEIEEGERAGETREVTW